MRNDIRRKAESNNASKEMDSRCDRLSSCGWRSKRIADFLEAYLSLMQEIGDKRNTVQGLIKDTKDLTGIDVVKLLDDITEGER